MTILILGCNKPNLEPESIDPIYKELLTELGNAQKEVADNTKKVEEAHSSLKNIVPQTGQTRKLTKAYHEATNNLAKALQKEDYFRVKSKLRKYEARRLYMDAFKAGEHWPDPAEYANYMKEKDLKTRSRNWRDRTPAYDAVKAFEDKQKKAATEQSSSGHH